MNYKILCFISLFFTQNLNAKVDMVDWTTLEEKWRKPLCLEEAVYPLNSERAKKLSDEREKNLKSLYSVSKIESLAYKKEPPSQDVLEILREIVLLKGLEMSRSKIGKELKLKAIKEKAKVAFVVCSRILNHHPSTRCHDFLLISIKPFEFMELVSQHYKEYQNSAIYLLDMQAQCRKDANRPDWNCSHLAKDYFQKNHLESCVARQMEPPEKVEPVANSLESEPPITDN